MTSHDRAAAVGADQDGTALNPTVGEVRCDAFRVLLHARAPRGEVKRILLERVHERELKLGSQDTDCRRSDSIGDLSLWEREHKLAAPVVYLLQPELDARLDDAICDADPHQGPHCIALNSEPLPDLAEHLRTLEQRHLDSHPAQGDGCRQPARACADDERSPLAHHSRAMRSDIEHDAPPHHRPRHTMW